MTDTDTRWAWTVRKGIHGYLPSDDSARITTDYGHALQALYDDLVPALDHAFDEAWHGVSQAFNTDDNPAERERLIQAIVNEDTSRLSAVSLVDRELARYIDPYIDVLHALKDVGHKQTLHAAGQLDEEPLHYTVGMLYFEVADIELDE